MNLTKIKKQLIRRYFATKLNPLELDCYKIAYRIILYNKSELLTRPDQVIYMAMPSILVKLDQMSGAFECWHNSHYYAYSLSPRLVTRISSVFSVELYKRRTKLQDFHEAQILWSLSRIPDMLLLQSK